MKYKLLVKSHFIILSVLLYSAARNSLRLSDLNDFQLMVLKGTILFFFVWFIVANFILYSSGRRLKIEKKEWVSIYVLAPSILIIGLLEFYVY
jgi:hypothetical protein